MNWIGGTRKRVQKTSDRRKQQLYFEKKRSLHNNTVVTDPEEKYKNTQIFGMSQDLIFLQTASKVFGNLRKSKRDEDGTCSGDVISGQTKRQRNMILLSPQCKRHHRYQSFSPQSSNLTSQRDMKSLSPRNSHPPHSQNNTKRLSSQFLHPSDKQYNTRPQNLSTNIHSCSLSRQNNPIQNKKTRSYSEHGSYSSLTSSLGGSSKKASSFYGETLMLHEKYLKSSRDVVPTIDKKEIKHPLDFTSTDEENGRMRHKIAPAPHRNEVAYSHALLSTPKEEEKKHCQDMALKSHVTETMSSHKDEVNCDVSPSRSVNMEIGRDEKLFKSLFDMSFNHKTNI